MTPAPPSLKAQPQPRALRLPIRTVLRYRSAHDKHWHRGNSVNASFTGMLIHVSHPLRVNDTTTLRLALPRELAGEVSPVVDIVCQVARHAGANRFGIRFLHAAMEQGSRKPVASVPDPRSGFHSLMQDLSIIVGNCDLLQQRTSEEQTSTAVRSIKRAAMKATATLRQGA